MHGQRNIKVIRVFGNRHSVFVDRHVVSFSSEFSLRFYITVPASYSGAQKLIRCKQYGLCRVIFRFERHSFTDLNTRLYFDSLYLFSKFDVCNFKIIILSYMLVKKL